MLDEPAPTVEMTHGSSASGGATAAGGFDFQANLGAIAAVHTLRGAPVQWTNDLSAAVPRAVSFETSGPGDDLSLELTDGSVVEIQAKKGLRADGRFWSALEALCEGIHRNRCSYGILIVCPNSSAPVRKGYALALERIGDGRTDGASPEQRKLASHLAGKHYNAQRVCSRIRIRMVSALVDAGDAITAARAELGHICAKQQQVEQAWHALRQDALSAIARKGRRTLRNLVAQLSHAHIDLAGLPNDSPVFISDKLLRWTLSRTEVFQVPGMSRPLPTDRAWLPLTATVRDKAIEPAPSVEKALADYHAFGEQWLADGDAIDARTIGTFRKLCVVIGGPGSGKSLLLRVLAREFAKDSYVSVNVRLRDLATRMEYTGCGVEEGLLHLGLDGTGTSPMQLGAASLSELVLLCDGLDECGERQLDIAAGLQNIAASHPSYRIVVTTRPIGYSTPLLHDWRHYEIAPFQKAHTAAHLATLCRCGLPADNTEATDQLRVRIDGYLDTYLKEDSVSQMLARSPLLLALAASLFLNSGSPGQTKVQLYERIFRLIEDPPRGRRTGINPPATDIRKSVLNQLGWLIAATPLLTAEDLQRHCANTLSHALDAPDLQARSEVEASVAYWEETGLIERLHHEGTELIAFTHKTFGEFTAARHLSEMQANEARKAIRSVLSRPDWDEILDFVQGTQIATLVAELLVAQFEAVDPDESILSRLFPVLVRPDATLSPADRRSFLEHAFALVRLEDRQKAYRVGLCLTEHDLSRFPEVKEMASTLLDAPTEWSRLIGWAVLACHFPTSVHRSALEDSMANFIKRSTTTDFLVLRAPDRPFGPLPDRGIFENFILGTLESLLPAQDAEYQDRLVADVWNSRKNVTTGFVSRLDALLRELGREDLSSPPFRPVKFLYEAKLSIPDDFGSDWAPLLTEVVASAFLDDDLAPPAPTDLKYLGALFELAGIMDVPGPDVEVWQSDGIQLPAVHSLLRAAACVYELPLERLSAEARQVVAIVESLRSKGEMHSILSIFPDVDVAGVDWSRASESDIEVDVVERLVHHPSQWVRHLAALFLNELLQGTARRSTCERMLASGSGDTLYWAAALAIAVPDGCELLIHRLGGCDTAGLYHLFDRLKEQCWRVRPFHLAVLEDGLVNRGAKTAVSAARWCQCTASAADTWLVELLKSASNHWMENEKPYPESRDIIPDSPREALLRTLCGIAPPTFQELVKLAGDPRSDVSNAAIDGVMGLGEGSGDAKSRLIESILAKRFTPRQCEKLLHTGVPYRSEELSILCGLLRDQDPAYRLVAVRRLLTHPRMDPQKALAAADSMRGDGDANVRDAIHQFLDREAEKGRQSSSAE